MSLITHCSHNLNFVDPVYCSLFYRDDAILPTWPTSVNTYYRLYTPSFCRRSSDAAALPIPLMYITVLSVLSVLSVQHADVYLFYRTVCLVAGFQAVLEAFESGVRKTG